MVGRDVTSRVPGISRPSLFPFPPVCSHFLPPTGSSLEGEWDFSFPAGGWYLGVESFKKLLQETGCRDLAGRGRWFPTPLTYHLQPLSFLFVAVSLFSLRYLLYRPPLSRRLRENPCLGQMQLLDRFCTSAPVARQNREALGSAQQQEPPCCSKVSRAPTQLRQTAAPSPSGRTREPVVASRPPAPRRGPRPSRDPGCTPRPQSGLHRPAPGSAAHGWSRLRLR